MARWENQFTGEVYRNLRHAIKTIVKDMIKCPGCRTIKMLQIKRF